MDDAHDTIIWSLAWHPMGHILASGSNDHSTYGHLHSKSFLNRLNPKKLILLRITIEDFYYFSKFWTRNRPGDHMRDRYNLNTLPFGISDEMADMAGMYGYKM